MRRALLLFLPALLIGCGTDVSGPAGSLLSCVYADAERMAPGDVRQVVGADNQALCVTPGSESEGTFAYIPFFATPAPGPDDPKVTIEVEVLGGAFRPPVSALVADPDAPVLLGGQADAMRRPRRRRDVAFHDWLRQREIRELTPLLEGGARTMSDAPGGAPAPRATAAAPAVGELLDFNVAISCTAEDIRTGRVSYVSQHAVIVQDTANPTVIDGADVAHFGETFDTLVHPVATAHFGEPRDIDENGRSILFFTRAVNERNVAGSEFFTVGFFWSGDLFPAESTDRLQGCPAGNRAEMFYLIAADPEGVAGPELEVDDLRELAVPLIGHEFQHLINASRRMFVNDARTFEDPWLNEGLSHVAEELLFYGASGLEPGMNLTADEIRAAANGVRSFNMYMSGNFGNFQRYLAKPDTASLMGIDNLSTRGATWSFLRYAADRTGGGDEAFFFDLVNSRVAGLENLAEVLGPEHPLAWRHDWTVSVYGDDRIPGLADRYRQASWHMPDIYGETVGRYPLATHSLGLEQPLTVELLAGGAAFLEVGVEAGDRAVVHLESDGRTPPSSVRGAVVRVR